MQLVAVLFVPPPSPRVSAAPLLVGGLSVLERQARQARRAGARRIVVVGPLAWGAAAADTMTVADPAGLARLLSDDVGVLLFAEGVVLDDRIVRAVAAAAPAGVALWPASAARGTERVDAVMSAAGIARYRGAMVREVAARLGDWDLHSTLLRTALLEPATQRIDVSLLPLHVPARRRDVPLTWALPDSTDTAQAATDTLLAAAETGCLDWPARTLYRPVEDAAVRLLLPTPVTPDMIAAAEAAVALAAVIAFAAGWLWAGLVLVLVFGLFDGTRGKLTRIRGDVSRIGVPARVLGEVAEYGWYAAIAAHFSTVSGNAGPWAVAALLAGFALASRRQAAFFRRFTGGRLDDAGSFERRFRTVDARRNTLFWTWLPFAVAGAWSTGFGVLALYAVATFFVMQWCFFRRLGDHGRASSAVARQTTPA
ncbi:MAG: hypothetical protein ACRYG4_22460 [Janthinobacterium lividum]